MRLNLEISDAQMASLRELQEKTGAGTMKELVNQAVSMLDWAVDETGKGHEIAAVNEETSTFRVLVTPLLQHVERQRELALRQAAKQAERTEVLA